MDMTGFYFFSACESGGEDFADIEHAFGEMAAHFEQIAVAGEWSEMGLYASSEECGEPEFVFSPSGAEYTPEGMAAIAAAYRHRKGAWERF